MADIVIDTHIREINDKVENISRPTVPDMLDRIIAATALHLNLPLITKDHKIRALQNIRTIWQDFGANL